MTATVHIVDDDASVRDSVRYLMESVGLKAVTYNSSHAFFETYADTGPACVVLDLRMPGVSGLETQEQIHSRGLDLPTIIVTGHGDVPAAVRAMKLGAVDFLEKPCNDQLLLDKVHKAIDLDVNRRHKDNQRRELERSLATLSQREREVMDLIVGGKSNKEVAQILSVSPKTVESHRASVMRKLDAGSLAELVLLTVTAEHKGEI